jgi:hypothetical protein
MPWFRIEFPPASSNDKLLLAVANHLLLHLLRFHSAAAQLLRPVHEPVRLGLEVKLWEDKRGLEVAVVEEAPLGALDVLVARDDLSPALKACCHSHGRTGAVSATTANASGTDTALQGITKRAYGQWDGYL